MNTLVEIPQPSRFRMEELFRDNNFVVPIYQRNYAWEHNEIEDFWDDLQDIAVGKRNSHFFGLIVTCKDDKSNQEIIDGQQRLTTSVIFMAVIRDIANELYKKINDGTNRNNETEEIGDKLRDIKRQVSKSIRGEKNQSSALTVQLKNDDYLNESLQEFFYNLTHSKGNITKKESFKPKENMRIAYKDIKNFITKKLKEKKTDRERIDLLELYFDSFFSNFYVVMISAPDRQDAFTIFETLNSRGKDLKASDIIKNHVMSLMNDNLDEANSLWNYISDKLSANSDKITRFIRTYWAARKRVVSEAKLYREISIDINNSVEAEKFLKDLKELVELYTVLESPLIPRAHYNYFENKRVIEYIDVLNRMHVMLYYPIILALKKSKFSDENILIVIHKIISVFVEHRTILNRGTSKLEGGFSDVARRIWDLELKDVTSINSYLANHLLPSNDQVIASFNVLSKEGGQRGAKKWTLSYLLTELYHAAYNDFSSDDNEWYEKVFHDDSYRIMQIPTDDSLSEYKNYIGNWILIEKNLVQKNYTSLNELKNCLIKSNLNGNEAVYRKLQNNSWTLENIKERQKELGDQVLSIWM